MTLGNILVAIDDSAAGRNAARFAAYLAGFLGGQLTALSVCPGAGVSAPRTQAHRDKECVERARAMLGERLFAAHPTLAIEVVATHGVPQVEIPRFAEEKKAGLIVLGRKPRTRVTRLILGDTTDAVVRRTRIPCLMVPAGLTAMRRVLVALDGTDRGLAVLRVAAELAADARLELSTVMVDTAPGGDLPLPGSRSERLTGKVDEYLRTRYPAFGREGQAISLLQVRQGDPVKQIAAEAAEVGADIVVTGFHPGGPLLVVEEGSISRSLVHTLTCAVLTVPL